LDLIVAEAMILANSTWGQWMAELSVPAIYRSQASMLPGVKVRMGTKALPHAGIGVPCYAWSTSPLRRYTDLVNQWQLVACVSHGNTAALVAPFKPKDVELFAIISSFEAAYSAYNGYQASMERFWTLKFLEQEQITELKATVIKTLPGQPIMIRALTLPLVMPVHGNTALVRGEIIRVKLQGMDLISLDIHAQFLESIEKPMPASASLHQFCGLKFKFTLRCRSHSPKPSIRHTILTNWMRPMTLLLQDPYTFLWRWTTWTTLRTQRMKANPMQRRIRPMAQMKMNRATPHEMKSPVNKPSAFACALRCTLTHQVTGSRSIF
jgi:hypothetical protein